MSEMVKKKVESKLKLVDKIPGNQDKNKRPNIDHLLKKISLERKEQKRNSLIMLAFGVIIFAAISIILV